MAKQKTEDVKSTSILPKVVEKRLQQLYFVMEEHKVDGIVVTYMPNIRYLTNFSGSAATLLLSKDKTVFVTDDRYEMQVKDELYALPNLEIQISRDVWELIAKNNPLGNTASLGFESDWVSYHNAVEIRNILRPVKFKPADNLVERFTQPKSDEELSDMKKAIELAEKVFDYIANWVQPGFTEEEIAIEITYQSRKLGSENETFPPIVTSGPRSAYVHGRPTDKKIKKNEIILLNFGCTVNGFKSDITRMMVLGKASKEQTSIYQILRDAQKVAIDGVCPGMNGKNLDIMARNIINDAGFGLNFQHSLGHGIGIVRNEKPLITFRQADQIIPEDCVLVIEPGIYLPDRFGIRVSDEVLVTPSGGIRLTHSPDKIVAI